jgi:molybdate transport system substrate-binding protein
VSVEQNVTAVLTKVAAGEADAGLVYKTDVADRDDVEAILPEGAADVVNRYPIAALSDASNPAAAEAFVRFVLSPRGQEILAEFGFGAP